MGVVCEEAGDGDYEDGEDRGGDVEELRFCYGATGRFVSIKVGSLRTGNYLREAQVGNDGWLIESQASGSYCETGPNKSEKPQPLIFESVVYFSNVEIQLMRSRRICGKSSFDEGFLLVAEPSGLLWNFTRGLAQGRDY
jgi:hypothetical protein